MTAALRQAPADFIRANTRLQAPPLVPEVRLYLASEVVPLWEATETELAERGLPPPFWAFAWAGGQALARYLLDHPEVVRGKRVLDFAAGSGLQGIAAKLAGAATVEAVDIDAFACAACRLNAEANDTGIAVREADLVGTGNPGWDVVLAGDVCYEGPAAARITAWLRGLAGEDCLVLMGDPGRTYLPKQGLEKIIAYAVKTSRELEDTDLRNAVVWKVAPATEAP
jgi:predicted nicotinamide N-methyase